jgi:hypothetical protein
MENIHYKLDKTSFQALSFEEADKQMNTSQNFSTKEKIKQFNYLMSIAYRFFGKPWPQMDKTYFEKKKRS